MSDSKTRPGKVICWKNANPFRNEASERTGPGTMPAGVLRYLTPLEAQSAMEEGWSKALATSRNRKG
ncbi:MAG: hypothetical protein WAW37_04395 [Syntrophobacteraceae bacterium]